MKKIGPMVMGILAVLVGGAMIVTAIALSNVLTYSNSVQGITITSTWASGPKSLGQENPFTVTYISPSGMPNTVVTFEFDCIGIVPANVTLLYNDGVSYVSTVFSQTGPDAIVGTTMAIVGGSSGGYDFKLTYNGLGTYTMKVWAG